MHLLSFCLSLPLPKKEAESHQLPGRLLAGDSDALPGSSLSSGLHGDPWLQS